MIEASVPGVSLFVLEAGMTLVVVAITVLRPTIGSSWFLQAERILVRLARRRALAVLLVGVAALFIRLAIIPLAPIPEPFVHDEFANLLAGDTFASGRLTNPTHPLWMYFESFHITQYPTYMSMYFPAQGMFLAAGQAWFGHPWFGVCISAALMCSAICWMLQGWLPPGWALLGGTLAVIRLGLFSYWVNSYYGGAVSAIGGALVLGALPRVIHRSRVRDGLFMAVGVAVLANNRPYEGLLVCVPVALALLWRMFTKRGPAISIRHALAPATLLLLVAGLMAYYNYRVFGNALTLPYQVNRATYAMVPFFIWEHPRPRPVYRHKVIADFYAQSEMTEFLKSQTLGGFLRSSSARAGIILFFFFGIVLFPPLIMLPRVLMDRRIRFLLFAGGVFALGLSLVFGLFPHYLAPFTCAIYAILLQTMRHLRVWRPGGQPIGLGLVRIIPLVCLVLAGLRLCAEPLKLFVPRWPSMWYGTEPLGLPRARIVAQLEHQPGPQLAIVRYSLDHLPFDDWVYNSADIDKSKIVWAREMKRGNDLELMAYFHERTCWIVEPDFDPPRVTRVSK